MTTIRYTRHFLTLILAVAALLLTSRFLDLVPAGDARFVSAFALAGAPHAISLVVSLRRGGSATSRIVFVALAAILSAGAPMLGLLLTAWLPYWDALGDSVRFILLWVFASAFGASGYWILVRSFWLRSLRFVDLIKTVALCVPATVLSWVGAGMVTSQGAAQPTSVAWDIGGLMPTAAWWVAFSFSLYWSEVRVNANDSIASTMMA